MQKKGEEQGKLGGKECLVKKSSSTLLLQSAYSFNKKYNVPKIRVARANLRITRAPRKRPHSQVFNIYSNFQVENLHKASSPSGLLITSGLNDLSSERDLTDITIQEWEGKYQYSEPLQIIVLLYFQLRILCWIFHKGFALLLLLGTTGTIPSQTCHSKHALTGFKNTQDSYGMHKSTLATVFTHCTFVLIIISTTHMHAWHCHRMPEVGMLALQD